MTRIEYCRGLQCLVGKNCLGPVDPHHVRNHTGMGLREDDSQTVPLCRKHHSELHSVGKRTFQARYGLDFKWTIERINNEYEDITS